MGYGVEYFPLVVQSWLDAGWLAPGHRLMEFGSQEFDADRGATRCGLEKFLQRQGLAVETTLGPADGLPSVRDIYQALGVAHMSIDVDGARGSTCFDLNTFGPPQDWRGAFDFVNNEGTIEHLVNPMNGFQVAHEIAKPGGVVRHNFPLIGWREHGFTYQTTKFYAQMIGDNGYELLKAQAYVTAGEPFNDPLFKNIMDLTGADGVPLVTNIWGELILRKAADRPFAVPVDHVAGPDADATRQWLVENHRRMSGARLFPRPR